MASAAPTLGSVDVDVGANLDRMLRTFRDAELAADRFDKALEKRVGRSAANAQRATEALSGATGRLNQSFTQTSQAADRYGRTVTKAANDSVAAAQRVDGAMASVRRSLMASASVIVGALGANELKNVADSYTRFTNQLKVAGIEGQRLADTQETLYQTAQRYGVQLESLGALHGRLTQSQRELGATSAQMIQFTNGVAAAIKVQGAGTEQVRGALLQLSQAMGSTIVRAEEYNSINEGARPILQAVANGIDRYGGSIAKLRADVIEGKLTSAEFFKGFLEGSAQLEDQAAKANLTIAASFQTLNNALGRYIGQTDEAYSITERMGRGIAALANNLDVIMPILTAIALAMGAKYVAAAGRMIVGTQLAQAAIFALQARMAAAATTMEALAFASAATGRAMLAAFGGPLGVAILAVGAAVFYFWQQSEKAQKQTEDFNRAIENSKKVLADEAEQARRSAGESGKLGAEHGRTAQKARDFEKATRDATSALLGQVAALKQVKQGLNDLYAGAPQGSAFAGATGDAATNLMRQAQQERTMRIQPILDAIKDLQEQRKAAETAFRESSQSGDSIARFGYLPPSAANKQAKARMDDLDRQIAAQRGAAGRILSVPLEDEYKRNHPNWATQGRDLNAEIKQYREQLVAAQKGGSAELQRNLLAEIKLRERILDLMKGGLNLENAEAQARAEKLGKGSSNPNADNTQSVRFSNPVSGRQSSGFGPRTAPVDPRTGKKGSSFHPAIDFAVPVGTSVKAPAGGVIIRTGRNGGLGNVVWIDHGNGVISELNHLSQSKVKVGDTVASGDAVALSGNTGTSTGPHLDWRVRTGAGRGGTGGRYVDPKRGAFEISPGDAAANVADAAEAQEEERLRNEEAFAQQLLSFNEGILDARQAQEIDEAKIAELEKSRINAARDRERDEIENKRQRGIYTDVQAQQLTKTNEELRQLELNGVALREKKRLLDEENRVRESTFERTMDQLQAEQDIARTASERRIVERRILNARKEYERQQLQAVLDNPFASELDKRMARGQMGTLDQRYDAQGKALDRQTKDDLLGTAPEGSETAHKQQMESLREQTAERLSIVREALDEELITREEYARRCVEIENDARIKTMELEAARWQVQLEGARQGTGAVLDVIKQFGGEQSALYKAIFIADKAFAIAQAIINIQLGIARAASLPFPANIPAIASVVAATASIVSNIGAVGAQFDVGGWTGSGPRNKAAGTVHGQEFVMRAGPAARYRPLLETMNAGRDPTAMISAAANDRGGLAGGMGSRPLNVKVENHAPGVRHEVQQIDEDRIRIIAREEAPGAVAADMDRPYSKVRKGIERNTTARKRKN